MLGSARCAAPATGGGRSPDEHLDAPTVTPRKFLLLAAVGPLLGAVRILGLLAASRLTGTEVGPHVFAWTLIACCWWGLTLPLIVHWSERYPLTPGALPGQLTRHLLLGVTVSVAGSFGYWATRWAGQRWLGTSPFSLRQLWGNLASSWLLFDLFMYAIALAAVSAVAYHRRLRERELEAARLETALVATEIRLLKAELDPHFLFNALNTISALVHRDPQAADRMVCRLADFLRLSLASAGTQEVTLEQELAHLRSYMEVQMVRFRGRLTLAVEVPPELLSCTVPNLLLQPLVENVVKHAVAKGLRPVHAAVRACRRDDQLLVEIDDDGPGLGEPAAGGRREGIGLTNTRARLRKLYGADHDVLLVERPGGGTRVAISLPYRPAPAGAIPTALELLPETPHVASLPGR
jgi:signal transduction histidine kinase